MFLFLTKAVLDWGLNPGAPTLEASILPLGYHNFKIGLSSKMVKTKLGEN